MSTWRQEEEEDGEEEVEWEAEEEEDGEEEVEWEEEEEAEEEEEEPETKAPRRLRCTPAYEGRQMRDGFAHEADARRFCAPWRHGSVIPRPSHYAYLRARAAHGVWDGCG